MVQDAMLIGLAVRANLVTAHDDASACCNTLCRFAPITNLNRHRPGPQHIPHLGPTTRMVRNQL